MQNQWLIRILIILVIITFLAYKFQSYLWPPSSFFSRNNNCTQSYRESNGFICESDELWHERKILYQIQDKLNLRKPPSAPYFLKNWEPNFHCSHARRIGQMGDGGKWICDLFRLRMRSNCLVYSAGSSGDFSFEVNLKYYLPNCEIHTFDVRVYRCPKNVCTFHQLALGSGQSPGNSQNWQMIIDNLGHRKRMIDVFKIDIEGGEFQFFPTIFQASNDSHPRQILVEVHPKTVVQTHSFFELLRANNYVIFNKEPNVRSRASLFEYAFLKLNSAFFQ